MPCDVTAIARFNPIHHFYEKFTASSAGFKYPLSGIFLISNTVSTLIFGVSSYLTFDLSAY